MSGGPVGYPDNAFHRTSGITKSASPGDTSPSYRRLAGSALTGFSVYPRCSAIFRISFNVFRIIVKQNSVSTLVVQISPRRGLSTEPVHNPVDK